MKPMITRYAIPFAAGMLLLAALCAAIPWSSSLANARRTGTGVARVRADCPKDPATGPRVGRTDPSSVSPRSSGLEGPETSSVCPTGALAVDPVATSATEAPSTPWLRECVNPVVSHPQSLFLLTQRDPEVVVGGISRLLEEDPMAGGRLLRYLAEDCTREGRLRAKCIAMLGERLPGDDPQWLLGLIHDETDPAVLQAAKHRLSEGR